MRFGFPLSFVALLAGTASSAQYEKKPLRPTGFRFRTKVVAISSGAQEVGVPGALDSETVARLRLRFEGDFSQATFDLDIFDGKSLTNSIGLMLPSILTLRI